MNSQKRLAIFVPSMRGGGAERAMLNVAREVSARGYPTDLVLARAEGAYLNDVPASVRLVDLKSSRVLASLPALTRYLRHERPQAMLSAMNYANIVALWARRLARVPTRVVVSEQIAMSRWAEFSSNWNTRLIPQLMRRFYPWADGIAAVSKGTADDLIQLVGLSRQYVHVIHNPVVRPELQALMQAPVYHPWFEPGQPPVVLAVSRLTRQKDFPTLIRAFARVHLTRPARLLILGEGRERPTLESLIKELDLDQSVDLPGFVDNPYAYMARASLFVLSSRWEGLPTVLIEAMYCGLPLVSTNCPTGPWEILREGRYGQLVPVGDVVALSQAIETTLAGKTPLPPEEGWQPYSQEAVASQYINILFRN